MSKILSGDAGWHADVLPRASRAIVALVAAEFVLLRVLNRVSGAFPESMRGPASEALAFAGTVAYNGAFLVAILLVALVGYRLGREGDRLAVPVVAWGVVLVAILAVGATSPGALVLADVAAAAVLAAVVGRVLATRRGPLAGPPHPRFRFLGSSFAFGLFLAAALAALLASLYLRAGDAMANLGAGPPARAEVFSAGEGLALLAAALAALAFWRPFDRWNVGLPIAGGLLLLAVALPRPGIVPLLAFWSFGFRLELPFVVYVGALAAYAYAVANAARTGAGPRYALYGLLLLGLSGRLLGDLYSVQIAVVSLMFLGLAPRLAAWSLPRAAPRPEASDAASGREAEPSP